MSFYLRSSKKSKRNKLLRTIHFHDFFSDNDILLYDDDSYDEDYDYVIIDDDERLNLDDDIYKDDTIYYL